MGNHWLMVAEVNELAKKLKALFKPYEDSCYDSMEEIVETMNAILSTFLKKYPGYITYIHYLQISYVSTSFHTDKGLVCRFDGCTTESILSIV